MIDSKHRVYLFLVGKEKLFLPSSQKHVASCVAVGLITCMLFIGVENRLSENRCKIQTTIKYVKYLRMLHYLTKDDNVTWGYLAVLFLAGVALICLRHEVKPRESKL